MLQSDREDREIASASIVDAAGFAQARDTRPGRRRAVTVEGPTRMLPLAGERRDCARASDCLGELLRAYAPGQPRTASCPPTCTSFQPVQASAGAGLGSWDEARLPAPPPDRLDAGDARLSEYARGRTRGQRGRFL